MLEGANVEGGKKEGENVEWREKDIDNVEIGKKEGKNVDWREM